MLTRLLSTRNLTIVALGAAAIVLVVTVILLATPGVVDAAATALEDPTLTEKGRLQGRFHLLVGSGLLFSLFLGIACMGAEHHITARWARLIAVGQEPPAWQMRLLYAALVVETALSGPLLVGGLFRDVLNLLPVSDYRQAIFVNEPVGKGTVAFLLLVFSLLFWTLARWIAAWLRSREVAMLRLSLND